MQITPLDILILAIVVFGLFRLFTGRRGGNDDDQPNPMRRTRTKPSDLRPPPIARQPGPAKHPDAQNGEQNYDQDDNQDSRREASEAYRRADSAWDHFRSKPDTPAPPVPDTRGLGSVAQNVDAPDDFDPEEFLAGAKAIYARVAEAWADRDLEDIRQFTSDRAYTEFKRRAEAETRPPRRQVMLVNAQLVEMQDQGEGQKATVFYDAMLGGPDGSRQAQEIWSFVRGKEAHDTWVLDETRPVEDSFEFQQ